MRLRLKVKTLKKTLMMNMLHKLYQGKKFVRSTQVDGRRWSVITPELLLFLTEIINTRKSIMLFLSVLSMAIDVDYSEADCSKSTVHHEHQHLLNETAQQIKMKFNTGKLLVDLSLN